MGSEELGRTGGGSGVGNKEVERVRMRTRCGL